MKISTDKTNYLLIKAGDSELSGTDYAVIRINDKLLEQLNNAKMLIDISKSKTVGITIQMEDYSCSYLEVEKQNESLFQHIEQLKQNNEWQFGFIDQELYNEIIKNSEIETCLSGTLNVRDEMFLT